MQQPKNNPVSFVGFFLIIWVCIIALLTLTQMPVVERWAAFWIGAVGLLYIAGKWLYWNWWLRQGDVKKIERFALFAAVALAVVNRLFIAWLVAGLLCVWLLQRPGGIAIGDIRMYSPDGIQCDDFRIGPP